jgi:hypothetical protein
VSQGMSLKGLWAGWLAPGLAASPAGRQGRSGNHIWVVGSRGGGGLMHVRSGHAFATTPSVGVRQGFKSAMRTADTGAGTDNQQGVARLACPVSRTAVVFVSCSHSTWRMSLKSSSTTRKDLCVQGQAAAGRGSGSKQVGCQVQELRYTNDHSSEPREGLMRFLLVCHVF